MRCRCGPAALGRLVAAISMKSGPEGAVKRLGIPRFASAECTFARAAFIARPG
jgi:hypothetical protein